MRPGTLRTIFAVEGITCLGTNLLLLGIYFYTKERLGWGLIQNLLLATGQGFIYVVGSLAAHPITLRLGRRNALVAIYAAMALLALAGYAASSPALITAILLLYTLVVSFNWPMLESLVSSDIDAHNLSRRIGLYNLVWSGTGAIAMAINGVLIEYMPAAVFLLPVVVHVVCAALMLLVPSDSPAAGDESAAAPHVAPDPELLPVRRLALALSRISLPATYVVIYGLMPLLPSLPVIKALSPVAATLVSSTWMAARFVTFWGLGASHWWHARPKILLGASVGMLLAFLGIVLPGAYLAPWNAVSLPAALTWMIAAQLLLGLCVGVIYFASLYFGMVLSEGSTEHGGYHEALIGLGSGLGPAAGAAAAFARPGNLPAGILAVTAVISLSVLATLLTPSLASRRPETPTS